MRSLGALLCGASAAALVALGLNAWTEPAARAQGGADGRAAHGAQAMERQMATLGPWLAPEVKVPKGVSPAFFKMLVPADNKGSEAQVALGKKLFFDTRLSQDGSLACATCHDVSRGFTDRRGTSEGIRDQLGRRNAPTTLNALFFATQFWDGRARTLEDQARLPIVNPIEMGQPNEEAALKAIQQDPEYQKAFQEAYGRPVNFDDLARAIAAFERTLVFLDSPFDRFAAGDPQAMSADAQAGWALYNGKARCTACHQISSSNPIGTDNQFHNVGVSARHQNFGELIKKALELLAENASQDKVDQLALQTDLSELGRFLVTRRRSGIGAFKTQQVRNVGVTAPYMHDGSMKTLWDVMDHYNKGGEANPFLDGGIEPLALTEREIDQLVAFMFALTDERFRDQSQAEMARQKDLAATQRPFRDNALANRKVFVFEARSQARGGKP